MRAVALAKAQESRRNNLIARVQYNQSMTNKERLGIGLIALVGITLLVILGLYGPIPQDPDYHQFSDTATFLSIPNTLNVVSNLPFLVVGLFCFLALLKDEKDYLIDRANRLAYLLLFLGITVVGLGSAYYHLSPNNETLVWDRLPMTVAFMALYAIIIAEFIASMAGKRLLWPLLALGVFSVLYWAYTESQNAGDLRLYAWVQYFPVLTIPIILLTFKSGFSGARGYWVLVVCYALAKFFEHFDAEIHDMLVIVSGHSIKHVLPVIGLAYLYKTYLDEPEGSEP